MDQRWTDLGHSNNNSNNNSNNSSSYKSNHQHHILLISPSSRLCILCVQVVAVAVVVVPTHTKVSMSERARCPSLSLSHMCDNSPYALGGAPKSTTATEYKLLSKDDFPALTAKKRTCLLVCVSLLIPTLCSRSALIHSLSSEHVTQHPTYGRTTATLTTGPERPTTIRSLCFGNYDSPKRGRVVL